MAKKCGQYAVTVHREDGSKKDYLPGEEFSAADAKLIDNPLAFEGGEDEETSKTATIAHTEPPPAPGTKGATKEAWQDYANHYNVPFTQEMSPKDIANECAARGVPVE